MNFKLFFSARLTRALQNVEVVSVEKLEEAFQSQNIFCVASGEKDNEMRFYFYGKHVRVFIKKIITIFYRKKPINCSLWSCKLIDLIVS